jgi:hypothetical protein
VGLVFRFVRIEVGTLRLQDGERPAFSSEDVIRAPFSRSPPLSKNHSTRPIAVQPSFSTVPHIILNQSLIPCYASPVSARLESHFMCHRLPRTASARCAPKPHSESRRLPRLPRLALPVRGRPALPKLSSTGLPRSASIRIPFKINTEHPAKDANPACPVRSVGERASRAEGSHSTPQLQDQKGRAPSRKSCRINTSESLSKERSLTTFRINTYAKTRGEGVGFEFPISDFRTSRFEFPISNVSPWSRHSSLATGLPPFPHLPLATHHSPLSLVFNHLHPSNFVTPLF